MSPWHTCNKCKLFVIGEKKNGCSICINKEISYKINYRKYSKSLLGIPLPLDIIRYISQLASKDFDNNMLLSVLELCWKARMHNIIL